MAINENINLHEDYVSFETAKLLKEKGFDEGCYTTYDYRKQFCHDSFYAKMDQVKAGLYLWAPTLQMAMKWLREVHNIFISIVFCTYPTEKRVTWTPEISTFDSVFPESAIEYDSYEEACEVAIKYCLENLI